jgi:hypothetical protein
MLIVSSVAGIPIRLSDERWRHIVARHVELATEHERVLATVADPDMILQGDTGELLAVRFYQATPLTSKHLVVAYREVSPDDGFILTAYLTSRPSARRNVVWKR